MISVVAILKVRDSEAFHAFESRAVPIMRSHGGVLVSAFETDDVEVHFIQFPTLAALDSYRSDPALKALDKLRMEAILDRQVYISRKDKSYA